MTQTLVVPTHYKDLAELAEGLAERVEADQLILFGPMPFDEDAELTFQVLLGDESIALEGRGRAAASVDGGDDRDQEYRYDIVIDSLDLNDRFMAVYDRILLMRNDGPSTNEHEAISETSDDSFSGRIDETTEFGAEGDLHGAHTSDVPEESVEDAWNVAGASDAPSPLSDPASPLSDPASPFGDPAGDEFAADAHIEDVGALVDEVSVVEAAPEELEEAADESDFYEQTQISEPPRYSDRPALSSQPPRLSSEPPRLSSRPPGSVPPNLSMSPRASLPVGAIVAGERPLYPEPGVPQKPAAPTVTPLGQGLERPSSAKAYSLEPEDEETLYPAPTGLFQYAKGELPAPQAPARPREHSFRPVQPAPSLAPIAPRGSSEGFADHLPSLRPVDVQLMNDPSTLRPVQGEPEDFEGYDAEAYEAEAVHDVDSVPAEAFDEVDSLAPEAADDLVTSISPTSISEDSSDVEEASFDDAEQYENAEPFDDAEQYDAIVDEDDAANDDMSSESLPPDALSGDSLSPESPKRDA